MNRDFPCCGGNDASPPECCKDCPERDKLPETLDEAIRDLRRSLNPEDLRVLLKGTAGPQFMILLGRWCRNRWKLWELSPLYTNLMGPDLTHPDDISGYIIDEFIRGKGTCVRTRYARNEVL